MPSTSIILRHINTYTSSPPWWGIRTNTNTNANANANRDAILTRCMIGAQGSANTTAATATTTVGITATAFLFGTCACTAVAGLVPVYLKAPPLVYMRHRRRAEKHLWPSSYLLFYQKVNESSALMLTSAARNETPKYKVKHNFCWILQK